MPYDTFPWFKDAPIAKVLNVTESSAGYFNWPDLYVDLSAGIIENPDRFPLIAK